MTKFTEFEFLTRNMRQASQARIAINSSYHTDETQLVRALLETAQFDAEASERINNFAQSLVKRVRDRKAEQGALDAFMQEYDLSSEEGVVLMCLAEALLRIPDSDTAEKLIADKLSNADWESHLGRSSSVFVNASTWGLMLTGKLVNLGEGTSKSLSRTLGKILPAATSSVFLRFLFINNRGRK